MLAKPPAPPLFASPARPTLAPLPAWVLTKPALPVAPPVVALAPPVPSVELDSLEASEQAAVTLHAMTQASHVSR